MENVKMTKRPEDSIPVWLLSQGSGARGTVGPSQGSLLDAPVIEWGPEQPGSTGRHQVSTATVTGGFLRCLCGRPAQFQASVSFPAVPALWHLPAESSVRAAGF